MAALHQLQMPVLVVAGERDEPYIARRRLVASIGANARLAAWQAPATRLTWSCPTRSSSWSRCFSTTSLFLEHQR